MHGKKPCGAELHPTRTIWLGEASSGRTEISPFKMYTISLFIACWLADLLETSVSSSLITLRSGLRLYHQSDHLKNSKLHQTSHWKTLTPEAVITLNKPPKSVITSQRNHQSWEGFSSDITQRRQQPEVSIDHAEKRGNTRSAVKLNWKQVNQTNIYCCWKLVNCSVCSKYSEVSACDLLQLKLRDSNRVLALNFLQTAHSWCVCVCVCIFVCVF